MRPKFSIQFLDSDYQSLLNKEITIKDFLETTLHDPSPDNVDGCIMCYHLKSYHDDEGGAPDVEDYEIYEEEFDEETLHGSFSTEFVVHFWFGCSDMNNEQDDYIKWEFQIIPESYTIRFTGEAKIEREPDAY